MKRWFFVLSSFLLLFGLMACSASNVKDPLILEEDLGLAQVRDYNELMALTKPKDTRCSGWFCLFRNFSKDSVGTAMPEDNAMGDDNESAPTSKTNVQVEGVDEGDIIKTDGNRIYRIIRNTLEIINLEENGQMSIALRDSMDTTQPEHSYTYYSDLYLTDDYLVVIGQRYKNFYRTMSGAMVDSLSVDAFMPAWWGGTPLSLITIYRLSDLTIQDEFEVTGSLITSRLIDNNLYLISNYYVYHYDTAIDPRPIFRHNEDVTVPKYTDIKYVSGTQTESFTIISHFSLENEVEANHHIFLGNFGWGQIYVSKEAIYMASTFYAYFDGTYTSRGLLVSYQFMQDGSVAYGGNGQYKGYVQNQFWMDEYDGYFRMFSTEGWGDTLKNRLYVFKRETVDNTLRLNVKALIEEGIGKPREEIKSARFNKNRATVVTYEQIDPLYTIDLTDPLNPIIKGELEVTGFSVYQHPWKENLIIGVGFEALGAQIDGIKLSLYDISGDDPVEVGNPLVLYNTPNSWTFSEALYNHKAILDGKDYGFIGFTINRYHYHNYNYFLTSDYLIFSIDETQENPIKIATSITHFDYFNLMDYAEYYSVNRAVFAKGYLYVVSDKGVTSHDIQNDFALLHSQFPA